VCVAACVPGGWGGRYPSPPLPLLVIIYLSIELIRTDLELVSRSRGSAIYLCIASQNLLVCC
jgi:hypothetical protein